MKDEAEEQSRNGYEGERWEDEPMNKANSRKDGNDGQASLPLPGNSGEDSTSGGQLLAEYRRLVRQELPQAAQAGHWSLRLDHCFARVILDALFGGCWYDHLARGKGRSAESQLDEHQLRQAVALARGMLKDGDAEVRRLDARSLAWRGKPPKRNAATEGSFNEAKADETNA